MRLLLLAKTQSILLTDPRYTIQASTESDCTVKIARGSLYEAAAKILKARRWKTRRDRAKPADVRQLIPNCNDRLGVSATLRPTSGLVEKHRMIKSAGRDRGDPDIGCDQLESFRAGHVAHQASDDRNRSCSRTRIPHAAERRGEAFVRNDRRFRRRAPRCRMPNLRRKELHKLLLIDMGCMQAGYASDMTRMLHLGKPGPETRKLYKAVLEAQLAALDAVRAGVTGGDVDRAARRVLKAHGFDKQFVHSTGHGLGLEIHEPPRLGKRDATYLEAGHGNHNRAGRIYRRRRRSPYRRYGARDRIGMRNPDADSKRISDRLATFSVIMTVDEIKELIQVVNESGIAELEVQRGENRVRIRRATCRSRSGVSLLPSRSRWLRRLPPT